MGDKNPKKKMKSRKPAAEHPAAENSPIADKKEKSAGKKETKK